MLDPDAFVQYVWQHMPPEIARPETVTVDGRGGVTQATYRQLAQYAFSQADQHLRVRFNLDLPDVVPSGSTLQFALSQLIAAYVLRRFASYQTLAKDMFANAFATLDEWAVQTLQENGSVAGPAFVEEDFHAEFPEL